MPRPTEPSPGHPPSPSQAPVRDPPSVRTVLGVLQLGRRVTAAELRQLSGLPRRTVYQALRVLRERGAVHQRRSLQDTRQSYFWLAEPMLGNVEMPVALRLEGSESEEPAFPSS